MTPCFRDKALKCRHLKYRHPEQIATYNNQYSCFLGDATVLDQRDVSGKAGHIFGLWGDPTRSSAMIYGDWVNRTVIKDYEVFMKDLVRPSQIYIQKPYRGPSK